MEATTACSLEAAPMFCWMLCLTAICCAPAGPLARFEMSQVHMGTEFAIVLYATEEDVAERAFAAAFDRIAQLDRVMSDYDPDSELSQLSRSAPTETPRPVSADLFRVLAASNSLSCKTAGAFDVTVGPLTKLWRRARRRGEFPAEDLLQAARDATGYRNLKLDPQAGTAELMVANMRLDLGGIAKGYAGDEALRAMATLGVTRAIVNAGGDVVAGEAPPGEAGWRVGVAALEAGAPPSRLLSIAQCAVATSGDLWQFVELGGVRYSHLLDPKTGLGLTTRSSVTIIAPTGMAADSLASAVSVLGPQAGLQLVGEAEDTEALILTRAGQGTVEHKSNGFDRLLAAEPSPKSD